MPARKPQANYLPFFGPYYADWNSVDEQPQFLTLPFKPRSRGPLARQLPLPRKWPAGTGEDLNGGFVYTAAQNPRPLASTTAPNAQVNAHEEKKGVIKKAWEVANTPIADLAGGAGTTRKFLVGDVDRMMAAAQRELDQRAARGEEITYWDALKSVGGLGMGKDAADLEFHLTYGNCDFFPGPSGPRCASGKIPSYRCSSSQSVR